MKLDRQARPLPWKHDTHGGDERHYMGYPGGARSTNTPARPS